MQETSSRRKFLKLLGLSAGATFTASVSVAGQAEEILELSGEQREFMLMYERWMDEYIQVIRTQKKDPANAANNLKIMQLTEIAGEWQEELRTYMQDRKFALIYHASIDRMKIEI